VTTTLDDAAVVAALDAVRRALDGTAAALERATAAIGRGQANLETVSDAARGLPGRGRDVRASLGLIHESLERAKLGALNAGLEAARIGEPLGHLVMQLSNDQRDLVTRALESLEAHAALIADAERERERWLDGVASAHAAGAGASEEVAAVGRHQREATASLEVLEHGLEPVLGTDPGTARLLLAVKEQAGKLAETIGELADRSGTGGERLEQALAPLRAALGREDPKEGS
jgi:methyl-accepting chemotaxis protein